MELLTWRSMKLSGFVRQQQPHPSPTIDASTFSPAPKPTLLSPQRRYRSVRSTTPFAGRQTTGLASSLETNSETAPSSTDGQR